MIAKIALRPPLGKAGGFYSAKAALRRQGGLILYGGLFLAGVFIGAVAVSWMDVQTADGLLAVLGGFVTRRQEQGVATTFFAALAPGMGALCLLLVCGFCALSPPLIALVPCFKGMGFGVSAAAMLIRYGWPAARYLAVLVMPNLIWSTIILLMCCRDAMQMSRSFWNAMKPQMRGPIAVRPGWFCGRVVLYALLLAVGAAVEANLFDLFGAALALG